MVNLTIKGTYVVMPEAPEVGSEVEVTLLEPDLVDRAVPGHVVRVGADSETGQSGVGIVFAVEQRVPPRPIDGSKLKHGRTRRR
jgi:hypothetical protein